MLGITQDQRQEYRSQVLATSSADYVAFSDRLDTMLANAPKAIAVVGPQGELDFANQERAKYAAPFRQILIDGA